jgi:hypothetical protein
MHNAPFSTAKAVHFCAVPMRVDLLAARLVNDEIA